MRARNNSVGRYHVEIFVRPMRYKDYDQAHNAKVVICALFATPNSLKLQEPRKAFSPIRKVRATSQKLARTHSRQIRTASDAPPRHTSRGFLHWRFAYAGPGARGAVSVGPASANLHNSGSQVAIRLACRLAAATQGRPSRRLLWRS
jgi:hypothetical protein